MGMQPRMADRAALSRAYRPSTPSDPSITWEILDAEHRVLDGDLAQYARTILGNNPELRPSFTGGRP